MKTNSPQNFENSNEKNTFIIKEEQTSEESRKNNILKKGKKNSYENNTILKKGVKALNVTEKNGDLAAFKLSKPESDMVIITDAGMVMRMPLDQVNTLSRVTQGVRLMKLKDNSTIATVSIVDKEKEESVDELESEEVINTQ